MTTWLPSWMNDMAAYFANPNVYMYGRWNNPPSKMEGGVDLGASGGTPVYALMDGQIIGAGNFWHGSGNCLYQGGSGCSPGYGVVTVRGNVPGYGLQDWYVQHIQINPAIQACQGNCTQSVHRGDLLGWVTPGVNEVETGFNADWGGVWGTNHPSAWATDPRPMLTALMQMGPPATLGGQPTYTGAFGSGPDVLGSLMNAVGLPSFADLQTFMQRFMIVFFGGMLILIGIIVLFLEKPENREKVKQAATEAAMAA